jgi:hypothetical protein
MLVPLASGGRKMEARREKCPDGRGRRTVLVRVIRKDVLFGALLFIYDSFSSTLQGSDYGVRLTAKIPFLDVLGRFHPFYRA